MLGKMKTYFTEDEILTKNCLNVIWLYILLTQAMDDILFPHLPVYWPHLMSAIEDSSVANALTKSDAHKVYGAILVSEI